MSLCNFYDSNDKSHRLVEVSGTDFLSLDVAGQKSSVLRSMGKSVFTGNGKFYK